MNKLTLKSIALFFVISLCSNYLHSQEISGQWNGLLSIQGQSLRLVFHISQTSDGYASTMDSPDQGASGISVASTTFDGVQLEIKMPNMGLLYQGEFKTDSIVGTFTQGALSLPMMLKRATEPITPILRPQEPKPPFPYRSEDVFFENKCAKEVTLAGTLTLPATGSNFTAVVLITGSGAQNRDEEIMGHKPFLVIADFLTRNGIAVLRFDDRGFGQSTGNFATATTADFATDVQSAIDYLKSRNEINPQKIGLMGHSEGGVIAPMVAANSSDVAFIVMLAGTGIRGDALLLLQQEAIYRVSGVPEEQISKIKKSNAKIFDHIVNANNILSTQDIMDFIATLDPQILPDGMTTNNFQQFANQISTPWMLYFLRYDPAPALQKVKCPVFAINGSKDLQVTAKENLDAIRAALIKGGNQKATIKEYPGLNHLFQECTTGSPTEYAAIEETFSPVVLKDLCDWILSLTF